MTAPGREADLQRWPAGRPPSGTCLSSTCGCRYFNVLSKESVGTLMGAAAVGPLAVFQAALAIKLEKCVAKLNRWIGWGLLS